MHHKLANPIDINAVPRLIRVASNASVTLFRMEDETSADHTVEVNPETILGFRTNISPYVAVDHVRNCAKEVSHV